MQLNPFRWRLWLRGKSEAGDQPTCPDESVFDVWCDRLDAYSLSVSEYGYAVTQLTGRLCWHYYFDRGLTPEEALRADKLAGV